MKLDEIASEKLYGILFSEAPYGIMLIDDKTKTIDSNKKACELLGYSKERLNSLSAKDIIHPDDLSKASVQKMFKKLKSKKEIEIERRYKKSDGSYIQVNVCLKPLKKNQYYLVIFQDISDQKQIETALEENKERYNKIFSNVSDAIMVFDAETRNFVDANEAVSSLYGYSKKEFIKLNHSDITSEPEESNKSIIQTIDGELSNIPIRYHKRKDGTIFPVEISTGTFKMGNRRLVFGVVRDITERTDAEASLRESEEKYRTIMETTLDAVYICSPDFKIEYMNKAMIKQIGRDATGETCYNSLHGLEDKCSWCLHHKVQNGEYVDQTIVSPGNNRSFHVSHAPLRNMDGSISKMAVFRDITELKQSEKLLKESENKFRAFAEQSLAGVYLIQDGNFKYVNPKFVEMFGYTKEEYLGKMFFPKLVHPDDLSKVKKQIRSRETGAVKTVHYEFRGVKKKGEIIHLEIFGSSIMIDGRLSAIGTILDISDRKLAEQEREKLISDLQQALKDVKQLSGLLPICSHCKKIRDDKGYWNQIETYISEKSHATFSHGICQNCAKKYYPELNLYDD